jgi:hypothetical protein
MASYEYNFGLMVSEKNHERVSSQENKTAGQPTNEFLPYYAALMAGMSSFGSVSFGNVDGYVLSIGADVAYFLNPWLGAGIKLNTMSCQIDFGETFSYRDMVIFLGPALHGRLGISKISCMVSAGAGGCIWMMRRQISNNTSRDNVSCAAPGGILSAGVNYCLTQQIGVGLNVQSTISTLKNSSGYERKTKGIGGALGIHYKF